MKADVVIAWSFAPVPTAIQSAFTRPTRFVALPTPPNRTYGDQVQKLGWPHPVRAILQQYAPGVEPLRVACLGFSESCHGVRNLLNSGDGVLFDAAVAIDGVHTPYINGKQVDPNTMKPWLDFGKLAVVNERLLAITHSSVVPPGYASTTETAAWLWSTLTNNSSPFVDPPLPDLSAPPTTIHVSGSVEIVGPTRDVNYPTAAAQEPLRAGGLVILGYDNLDARGTADHIYQAKVMLPIVVSKLLAQRWNEMDPENMTGSCYRG